MRIEAQQTGLIGASRPHHVHVSPKTRLATDTHPSGVSDNVWFFVPN